MKKFLALATITLLAANSANATEFIEVDKKADGYLSFEEFIAVMPDITEDASRAIDINQDGQVDADDFAAAVL